MQMEIIQQPEHKRILMIFEGATHIWREIYMDGRKFPEGDELNPTYLGYSVGRWENPDTLVVENKGFNENSWLDYFGPSAHRQDGSRRAVDASEQQAATTRRRSPIRCMHQTVHDGVDIPWREAGELPEHLPGEQPVSQSSRGRFWQSDLRSSSAARTEEADDGNPLGK